VPVYSANVEDKLRSMSGAKYLNYSVHYGRRLAEPESLKSEPVNCHSFPENTGCLGSGVFLLE